MKVQVSGTNPALLTGSVEGIASNKYDTNKDGKADLLQRDTDGDGVLDRLYTDNDHDGKYDRVDVIRADAPKLEHYTDHYTNGAHYGG